MQAPRRPCQCRQRPAWPKSPRLRYHHHPHTRLLCHITMLQSEPQLQLSCDVLVALLHYFSAIRRIVRCRQRACPSACAATAPDCQTARRNGLDFRNSGLAENAMPNGQHKDLEETTQLLSAEPSAAKGAEPAAAEALPQGLLAVFLHSIKEELQLLREGGAYICSSANRCGGPAA